MNVLIQAGHYPNAGGAPGEAAWTWELGTRIVQRLRNAGVAASIIGDFYNKPAPSICAWDFDLFVALHYDAAIYAENTGCFAGRALFDPCGAQADAFIRIWERIYPAATGIPIHNERLNPNVTDYYGFHATSARTPGVLIEHGVGQGLDHSTLFDRIDVVADADVAAILEYLGIGQTQEADVSAEDAALLAALRERDITTVQDWQNLCVWTDEIYREWQDRGETNTALNARLQELLANPPASVVRVSAPASVRVEVEQN